MCLGLNNKIDLARKWTMNLDADIFFASEADLSHHTDLDFIQIEKRSLHSTLKDSYNKSRIAAFIKNDLKYKVSVSEHVEAISIKTGKYTIIGVYRPFTYHSSPADYVKNMIKFVSDETEQMYPTVILGDMNFNSLSDRKTNLQKTWELFCDEMGLIQKIKVPTWQRCINGNIKSSILDHIYCNFELENLEFTKDLGIGDHLALLLDIETTPPVRLAEPFLYRSWKNYTPTNLCDELQRKSSELSKLKDLSVDEHNFQLTNITMTCLSNIAPESLIQPKKRNKNWSPKCVKLLRKKRRLRKKLKHNPSAATYSQIKACSEKIKTSMLEEKQLRIRKIISDKSNPQINFWRAVNEAKGHYTSSQKVVSHNGIETDDDYQKSELWSVVFQEKTSTSPPPANDVFNGDKLIDAKSRGHFSKTEILQAIKQLNSRKSFGHDRWPLTVLKDGAHILLDTIHSLFKKIYDSKHIPDIWRISRVLAVHKKGDKKVAANYRPISNMCSLDKLFQKCILRRLTDLEEEHGVDLTGVHQFGFKKGFSTTTLCLKLQEHLSVFKSKPTAMGSLDLTAAFDVVPHDLLINRLHNYGIPDDITELINDWLTNRTSYVECNLACSMPFPNDRGTVQGSILGPVLFSMFIRPLNDIVPNFCYADDTYFVRSETDNATLVDKLSKDLTTAVNWFRDSGLLVNPNKTEILLMKNKLSDLITVRICAETVQSKKSVKVLGIMFDEDLKWTTQVESAINKTKKACSGIKHLKKFIDQDQMLQLAHAFCYSKLYYGASIWLSKDTLCVSLLKRLKSVSAYVLKCTLSLFDWQISYNDLHCISGVLTPALMSQYFHVTELYRILATARLSQNFHEIVANVNFNVRTNKLYIPSTSKNRAENNKFKNRLSCLRNFRADSFNYGINTFKKLTKEVLFKFL